MNFLYHFLLSIWINFPISSSNKIKFKEFLFTHFSFIFQSTSAYEKWILSNKYKPCFGSEDQLPVSQYTPIDDMSDVERKPVKFICFYLPQYHPIPENDLWWGKGFTEWTNVRPAVPIFDGHYQPHEPGELGYYSLLDKKIQRRQIELAKKYGIEGFCFYFYWFGGTRLLESPIINYLSDLSLDLPFCLCWANENWSRRWDGLDSEVLISQNYSDEDDLKFIKYISTYLKDPRYIKIQGKPLLLVYRPNLLPDIKKTVKRWREWCLSNGIGEIFLAYTESFESVDPSIYDFDAAVEFPPNNSSPPNVTGSISPLTKDFNSTVYDWRIFIKRSQNYNERTYKLFRSICPSWDNTARRKKNSTVFINSSPALFKQWALNAIRDTVNFFDKNDERLVFINAWNEWAEGAHLEPDKKYGYGYLDAIRSAICEFNHENFYSIERQSGISKKQHTIQEYSKLAIVIHAYYLDVFVEILNEIDGVIQSSAKFFVTCTKAQYEEVIHLVKEYEIDCYVMVCENKGRDVLPFLKILPKVLETDFSFLIKLHTKKSPHRADGELWRKHLISQLISRKGVDFAFDNFNADERLGLLGPSKSVVPMEFYLGSNYSHIEGLANKLFLRMKDVRKMNFVAGTMFYLRRSVAEQMVLLDLKSEDFEEELGQTDGTMAHALERVFSLVAYKNNFHVKSFDQETNNEFYFAAKSDFKR